jgi:hypothetical protein
MPTVTQRFGPSRAPTQPESPTSKRLSALIDRALRVRELLQTREQRRAHRLQESATRRMLATAPPTMPARAQCSLNLHCEWMERQLRIMERVLQDMP